MVETPTDGEVFSEIVEQAFFSGPCKCCGSKEHGVLRRLVDKAGKEKIDLACSVSREESWKRVTYMSLKSMRVRASFANFSSYHNHNSDQLNEAISGFTKYGDGRHMHYMELVDFDNDAQRYSKVVTGNNFKRNNRPQQSESDEGTSEAVPLKTPRL